MDEKEYTDFTDHPHPDFVKGFNEGYILAQYAPEIGGIFGKYTPESERGKGFHAGTSQYAINPTKDREQDKTNDEPSRDRPGKESTNPRMNTEKELQDNKSDITGQPRKEEQSLTKAWAENRANIGVGQDKDHLTDWLKERDETKSDMDLDRGPDIDRGDYEPELE